ncbi:MerR family transcriptional regulator [uncultured Clostridium sp.]|uniref:MerR family transcriptional regulator n=1 Tax=uncultured Clostridium sp. TaxID=59620 RepID=UPI0025CDD980|nr:MerR family transcriptional regulator [uncultured Clostridium sp.]
MYTIKQISEITGISAYTIRFYDNKGLFPFLARDKNNVRLFSDNDLDWIHFVHCLRNTGMSIADIKKYIELSNQGPDTAQERYKMMVAQKEKAEKEAVEIQKRIELLNCKINHYKDLLNNLNSDFLGPENCKAFSCRNK